MMLVAAGTQAAACGIMFTRDAATFAAAQKVYMAGMAVQGIFILGLMLEADRLARSTLRMKGSLMWTIYAALVLLAVSRKRNAPSSQKPAKKLQFPIHPLCSE